MCLLSSVNLQLTNNTVPHTFCLPIHCTGKLEVAEALYREVLASQHRVLGLDHPSTLLSTNNLAICLAKQGELQSLRTCFIPMLFIKLCPTTCILKEMKRGVPFELCQVAAYKQYIATHSLPTNSLHRQSGGC
jgi:hypothetical protein